MDKYSHFKISFLYGESYIFECLRQEKFPRYFIVFYLMFHRKPNWKLKLNLRFLKTFSMLLPLSK